jgi:hypothetical protein
MLASHTFVKDFVVPGTVMVVPFAAGHSLTSWGVGVDVGADDVLETDVVGDGVVDVVLSDLLAGEPPDSIKGTHFAAAAGELSPKDELTAAVLDPTTPPITAPIPSRTTTPMTPSMMCFRFLFFLSSAGSGHAPDGTTTS